MLPPLSHKPRVRARVVSMFQKRVGHRRRPASEAARRHRRNSRTTLEIGRAHQPRCRLGACRATLGIRLHNGLATGPQRTSTSTNNCASDGVALYQEVGAEHLADAQWQRSIPSCPAHGHRCHQRLSCPATSPFTPVVRSAFHRVVQHACAAARDRRRRGIENRLDLREQNA